MRGKREVVHLLDLVLGAQEGAVDEGDFRAAQAMGVQADTLEYILGVEGTKTEQFLDAVDGDEADDAPSSEEIEDVIASILNGSIERAYVGGR